MNNIGARLKNFRIGLNLKTQSQFAEALKLSQATLSKYEKEISDIPDEIKLKLATDFNVDLHWLLTGKGAMFHDQRIHGKNLFEIPFLKKEEAMDYNHKTAIPEPKANSGDSPDYDYVLVPMRLLDYSTDLRAFEVFGSRMHPVLKHGDIAIIEATGWNGNGIYLYRMGGGLHISYAGRRKDGQFQLCHENESDKTKPVSIQYDAQTFEAIGRVRAVVKDLFAADWIDGNPPPRES
jgi:transcriptional regulator with XRE-family HTH domain